VAAGLIMTGEACAQAYTPPPPPLTTAPCVPTKKNPCDATPPVAPAIPATADQFPFPGEAPGTVPDIPTDPSLPGAPPSTPPATAPGAAKPTPSQQFPFPGETPDAPVAGGQKPVPSAKFPFPGEPDESSSSSSSSSSGGDVPSDDSSAAAAKPGLKDAGSTGSTRFERKHLAKVEDTDHRELEDLDVSHYYMTTGNFQAAYMRAEDAVKLYPDDENAHIALAVSADKLKKKDEAVAEYKAYLKLAPDGEKAKEARRSLEALGVK